MSGVQQIEPEVFVLGGFHNALEHHDLDALRPIAQGYLDLESMCGWAKQMTPHLRQVGEEPLAEAMEQVIMIGEKVVEKAVLRIPLEAPPEDDPRPIWEQAPPGDFVLRVWQDLSTFQEIFAPAQGEVPKSWEPVLEWAVQGLSMAHINLWGAMEESSLSFGS